MKILLLIDKPNWAFHRIANGLMKYNTDNSIDFSCHSIKKQEKNIKNIYKKYDLFYVMGMNNYERINFLPKGRTMIGIHSCHAWDGNETTPTNIVYPDTSIIEYLNSFLRVDAVSIYLYDIFKKLGVKNLYYTPNGVDSNIFRPYDRNQSDFVVGYAGVKSHDWLKGVNDIIIPAAQRASVKTHLALRLTDTHHNFEEMSNFYNLLDAYICSSLSEGFSLSVLEAASCGVPVISTRVSGCTELIKHNNNGLFIDRNVDDLADKIDMLKDYEFRNFLSANMRKDIIRYHCWSKKIDKWIKFFKGE